MAASKVRADYEQLTHIAQAFGQQAETAQQVLGALQDNMQTLQGGDWVGKGADAFYAEMNAAVLPAMKRVVAAMNEATSTTAKISRIMKQAEDDSAALFRLDGGNGASGGAAGLGAVFGAAGAVGAAASAQAGGNVMSEPQFDGTAPNVHAWGPTKRKTKHGKGNKGGAGGGAALLEVQLERLDREGWTIETGDTGDATYIVQPGPPGKIILNPKRAEEGLNDAIDDILYSDIKLLSGLDPKLAAQAKKDPILMEQLRQLDKEGWTISTGETSVNMVAWGPPNTIILDTGASKQDLAKQVREAIRGYEPEEMPSYELEKTGSSKDSRTNYVSHNYVERLRHDAEELLSMYLAHQAVYGKMPDILPFTTNGQESVNAQLYKDIVTGVQNGTIERGKAISVLIEIMRHEPSGISNARKYEDYYMNKFDQKHGENQWARQQISNKP